MNLNEFSDNYEFIDSLSSYMYLPYILHPTKVTGHSQTIIDNIFSNYV